MNFVLPKVTVQSVYICVSWVNYSLRWGWIFYLGKILAHSSIF